MIDKILVTNIQRFSLHDGPGIRTTVFLKGCSIRCPWCCNPENISNYPQNYKYHEINGIYGHYYTINELYEELIKDKIYFQGSLSRPFWNIKKASEIDLLPGGITFSGGETLLQSQSLLPVFNKLNKENIHITVETSLFVPKKNIQIAIDLINFFIVDVKILNEETAKKILNGNLKVFIQNFEFVINKSIPVVIRIPLIGKYTDTIENISNIRNFLSEMRNNSILKIELIKEHNLGNKKYESLGYQIPDYYGISDKKVKVICDFFTKAGFYTEICQI